MSLKGRCKNCRFWGTTFEKCCDRVDQLQTDAPEEDRFEIDLWANDDQGLRGVLKTGPNFCCSHFDPIDPKEWMW